MRLVWTPRRQQPLGAGLETHELPRRVAGALGLQGRFEDSEGHGVFQPFLVLEGARGASGGGFLIFVPVLWKGLLSRIQRVKVTWRLEI